MSEQTIRTPAHDPQELERLLVSRQNAGDVDGMTALYEPLALLDFGAGQARGPGRNSRILPRIGRVGKKV